MEYVIHAANEITRILSQRHETAYAVHEDTQIPHIHFAFNPVSYIDGYKYHGGKQEFRELMDMFRGGDELYWGVSVLSGEVCKYQR